MRGVSEERFGRFHHRLAEGRMRMDRSRHIFRDRTHLHCQDSFRDQLARTDAAESYAENTAGLRIEHELRQAFVASQRRGAP